MLFAANTIDDAHWIIRSDSFNNAWVTIFFQIAQENVHTYIHNNVPVEHHLQLHRLLLYAFVKTGVIWRRIVCLQLH